MDRKLGSFMEEDGDDMISEDTPMISEERIGVKSDRKPRKRAERLNRKRSKRARTVDKSKQNSKVFSKPLSSEEVSEWASNPGKFDLEGVDTKESDKDSIRIW